MLCAHHGSFALFGVITEHSFIFIFQLKTLPVLKVSGCNEPSLKQFNLQPVKRYLFHKIIRAEHGV